jgi:hypothetical protein
MLNNAKPEWRIISVIVVGLAAFSLAILIRVSIDERIRWPKQLFLALKLGVDPTIFSGPFPVPYYEGKLNRGDSRTQVHVLVQNYSQVFHCGQEREIYYYFGKSDNYALRFEVWYDAQGNYDGISGEDDNSRSISTKGCVLGRLVETP